ncbi:hypothetical protein [Enterovibrio norvegicus]|uniref:hypothetical protein n=1 Tax=Enterovibrio norvegicus TaxID=188144 RepID=UPI0035513BFC
MALKPCKECNEQISSDVAQCPHCGSDTPMGKFEAIVKGGPVLVLFGVILYVWLT